MQAKSAFEDICTVGGFQAETERERERERYIYIYISEDVCRYVHKEIYRKQAPHATDQKGYRTYVYEAH